MFKKGGFKKMYHATKKLALDDEKKAFEEQ
jgi:hypothetical protein